MQQTRHSRQIRAVFDDETITVYQAFAAAIAIPAASNCSFSGTPFKLDRMTWIKPSYLWMMYRSGWATKSGQEHVLAIRITRSGFEHALSQSCLSHYDPAVYPDRDAWEQCKQSNEVRVQWDPERDIDLERLPYRSLQVGLSGQIAHDYVGKWIIGIDDVTPGVHEIHRDLVAGQIDDARSKLPAERAYPLPHRLARITGAAVGS